MDENKLTNSYRWRRPNQTPSTPEWKLKNRNFQMQMFRKARGKLVNAFRDKDVEEQQMDEYYYNDVPKNEEERLCEEYVSNNENEVESMCDRVHSEVCPQCYKDYLQKTKGWLRCLQCPFRMTEVKVNELKKRFEEHSKTCISTLNLYPDMNSAGPLNFVLVCVTCDFMDAITV